MRIRRACSWLGLTVAAVSLLAAALTVYAWVRSYRTLDQYNWQRLVFDPTPQNRPPYQPELSPRPPKVYPPGTTSWRGRFIGWRLNNLRGRVLLRVDEMSNDYERPEPMPELKPLLGWSHTAQRPDMDMSYNVPRGNVWLSWREFNWNGLATWDTYMDGESAQMVMMPHWALVCVAATPGALWLLLTARRRWRWRPGHCGACGYNLAGVKGVCPECGAGAVVSR